MQYFRRNFPGGSEAKDPPAKRELQETQVRSLGREDPLEEGMATHSSVLAGECHGETSLWATVHTVPKSWT